MKSVLSLFFVFTIITFQSSCLKKQNLDDDNLGPAIEPLALTKAMGEGFGTYDFNDIKTNEFTSFILTQKIQDSFVQTLEQQDLTVEKAENTVDQLSLDVLVTKLTYSNGQSSQSTRKWNDVFSKSTSNKTLAQTNGLTTTADASRATYLFLVFQSLAFGSCYNQGDYPETCHRLEITDLQYQVPPAAAAQHQCSDPNQCYIPARKIEFDMIRNYELDKDGKPKRTHYTLLLSKSVPFLSRVLQFCSRSLYEITNSNQKILADLCYNVNNYASGQ